jgi:hypothetical protein
VFIFSICGYAVYSPTANRGPRNNIPQPNEFNKLPSYEVKTTQNDERWNLYRILRTGQIVRLRLTVTEIRRITDRFDQDGLPFYLVTSGPTIVINPQTTTLQP